MTHYRFNTPFGSSEMTFPDPPTWTYRRPDHGAVEAWAKGRRAAELEHDEELARLDAALDRIRGLADWYLRAWDERPGGAHPDMTRLTMLLARKMRDIADGEGAE